MKKTRKIRLLAFILTLCMTIGVLPLCVLADGTEAELPEQITETTNENLTAFQLGLGEKSVAELENMTLSAADIPASITRETVEAKDHVLRLREQEADLNTVIFQNRDGGKTVYLFGSPVKYVDANGNIRDKSTTLVSKNVTVNGKTYAHSATDNFFGQYYPTMPQNGVMLAFGPYTVEMKPVITGVLTLRDTVVADNKVTYNKVFGTGTSLVYTPTLYGIKEDIILQTYTGKSSFSFTLKTNGLAIIQDENDTFLADFEGNKVASLGNVIITDNVGKTVYGTMTVVTKIEREEYTVTVNAPTAFLTNPTTVYPVTVDPTFTIEKEFTPDNYTKYTYIEDLCIYDGSENPYSNGIASIGNYYYSWESDAEPNSARMLYKLTENASVNYNLEQLFSSSNLYSAKINLFARVYESDVVIEAYPYDDEWTAGTSAWVSMLPEITYDAEYYRTTIIDNTSYQTIEVDLTDVFNNSLSYLIDYGFMLKVSGEGGGDIDCYNQISLYQTEHFSYNVNIVIDYTTMEGEYYINNYETGHFVESNGLSTYVSTDTYSSSDTMKMRLLYAGNNSYYIIPINDLTQVIYQSGSYVKTASRLSTMTDYYKWILEEDSSGCYKIKNVGSGSYLYANSYDSVSCVSYATDNRLWRLCKTNNYHTLENFSVEDIVMEVGETVTPTITKTPTDATWTSASDFTYTSSDNDIVTVSSNGAITPQGSCGKAVITATHKLSGITKNYNVDVVVLKNGIYHIEEDGGSEQYVYCTDSRIELNSLCLYNSADAGKYLWGFTLLDDGSYKIVSQYILDNNRHDTMALTLSNNSLSLTQFTNLDTQKWMISKNNDKYSLYLKSDPSQVFYIEDSSKTLFNLHLDQSYEDKGMWNGTYEGHIQGEVLNLYVIAEDTVCSQYFNNATNSLTLFYEAVNKWNGLCDNVVIHTSTSTLPDNYYVVEFTIETIDDRTYGKTIGYSDSQEKGLGDNWDRCLIQLDADSSSHLSVSDKQNVITHELGHALKLSHPFQGNINHQVTSVMNNFYEGYYNYNERRAYEPTARDVYYLNFKWN